MRGDIVRSGVEHAPDSGVSVTFRAYPDLNHRRTFAYLDFKYITCSANVPVSTDYHQSSQHPNNTY